MRRLLKNKTFLLIVGANLFCLAIVLPGWLNRSHKNPPVGIRQQPSDSIAPPKRQPTRENSIVVTTADELKKAREDSLFLRVMHLEAAIISRAANFEELVVVSKYMHPNSKNFPFIPAIIPLKPGTYKRISSHFGMRFHPIKKRNKMHFGMDISATPGTPVFATADGVVVAARSGYPGYGTIVEIKHALGFSTIYGHLKQYSVSRGQSVTRGTIIGTVGNTGYSTGPHLHYEIIKNKRRIDPIRFTEFAKGVLLNGYSY